MAFNLQSVFTVLPVADFDWNPPFRHYSDTVMVISISNPNGGEIVKYNWTLTSLGDKGSWTSPNNASSRTLYAQGSGDISVTLNVTALTGFPLHEVWDAKTKNITILAPPPLTPVGGIYIQTNKLSLLAPYIGLTTLLAVAATTVVCAKKKRRK